MISVAVNAAQCYEVVYIFVKAARLYGAVSSRILLWLQVLIMIPLLGKWCHVLLNHGSTAYVPHEAIVFTNSANI